MLIAAAYIRVSTDEQTEYSPAAQRDEILSFARENGFFIPNEFIFSDEGISGRSAEKRPAFQNMIRHARKKSNHIEAIIVHKFDRFARSKQDAVLYKALLKKDGVRVLSVKEPIPQDDKFAVIYESMLEAMAEYYSLNLAEEVKKTMLRKAELGEYQAHAPFGYRNAGKSLIVEPEQAKIVAYIFRQYVSGASIFQICQNLNGMGCFTNRRNPFDTRAVAYLLHNPVYKGYARWTPAGAIERDFNNPASIVARGDWEAIVSESLWNAAAERLQKRAVLPRRRYEAEGRHWLSGMVKCSACGRSLILSAASQSSFTLQCGGYNHGRCSVSHSLSARVLLPALFSALDAAAGAPCRCVLHSQAEENEEARLLLEQAITRSKARLEKAKSAFLDGIDTLEEYKKNKTALLEKLHSLEQKREGLPPQKPPLFAALSLCMILRSDEFALLEKRAAFCSAVEKMIFQKPDRRICLVLSAD